MIILLDHIQDILKYTPAIYWTLSMSPVWQRLFYIPNSFLPHDCETWITAVFYPWEKNAWKIKYFFIANTNHLDNECQFYDFNTGFAARTCVLFYNFVISLYFNTCIISHFLSHCMRINAWQNFYLKERQAIQSEKELYVEFTSHFILFCNSPSFCFSLFQFFIKPSLIEFTKDLGPCHANNINLLAVPKIHSKRLSVQLAFCDRLK